MHNQTISVIALVGHKYADRWHNKGERYEADLDMVQRLLAFGFARVAEEEPTKPTEYKRRDMRAES